MLTRQEMLEKAAQSDIDLLDARIDTVYGEEVEFDTKLKLYRHLDELQGLTTLTGALEDWYEDSLSGTEFAKFVRFENMYRDAVTFEGTDATDAERLGHEVDSLSNLIDTLGSDMDSIVWWVADTSSTFLETDALQVDDIRANSESMAEKIDTLSILIMARQAVLDTLLDDMLALNSSISTPATTSGQNLKAVNGYLVERYDSGFAGFDNTDSTALAAIANQCVGEGGEAVYIARALLAEITQEAVEYEDECVEERSSKGNGQRTLLASSLKVVPIPADDRAEVLLPKAHHISSLTLLDAYGRSVRVLAVAPMQTSLKLDTRELAGGVYFLVPFNGEDAPVRFAVQH